MGSAASKTQNRAGTAHTTPTQNTDGSSQTTTLNRAGTADKTPTQNTVAEYCTTTQISDESSHTTSTRDSDLTSHPITHQNSNIASHTTATQNTAGSSHTPSQNTKSHSTPTPKPNRASHTTQNIAGALRTTSAENTSGRSHTAPSERTGASRTTPTQNDINMHVIGTYTMNLRIILGKGAYGTVYLGTCETTTQSVVGKEIRYKFDDADPDAVEKMKQGFNDEVNCLIMGQGHPNIVKYLGVYNENQSIWIIMEFCTHGDLHSYVEKMKKALPENTLVKLLLDASQAVAFLHQQTPPVVHRDIKLKNFLIQDEGGYPVLKLCDFGQVKLLPESLDIRTFYMSTEAGTRAFMAPEFYYKVLRYQYTKSVDIFSLGLVFQVLINYDGNDQFLLPSSVMTRRTNMIYHVGLEISMARTEGRPMPELFEHSANDSKVKSRLKRLTEKMVLPLDRLKAQQVREELQMIQEIIKSHCQTVVVCELPSSMSEDELFVLMESRMRSGGGPVKSVKIHNNGTATVVYEQEEDARGAVNKGVVISPSGLQYTIEPYTGQTEEETEPKPQDRKSTSECTTSPGQHKEIHSQPIELLPRVTPTDLSPKDQPRKVSPKSQSPAPALTSKDQPVTIKNPIGRSPVVRSSFSLNTLASKSMSIQHTRPLPGRVDKMALYNDELLCLTYNLTKKSYSIEVYNPSTREHKRTVTTQLSQVKSMTVTSRGQVLIATTKEGLVQCDLSREGKMRCINIEPHYEVTSVSDGVVALRMKDRFIHIDQYNSSLERIKHKATAVTDVRITCSATRGSVYICSADQNCIYRLDPDTGKIMETYGCRGTTLPGHLKYPRLCCTYEKILLVADYDNNRFQILNCETNEWKVLNIEGLKYPKAAIVDWKGRLYVHGEGVLGSYKLHVIYWTAP